MHYCITSRIWSEVPHRPVGQDTVKAHTSSLTTRCSLSVVLPTLSPSHYSTASPTLVTSSFHSAPHTTSTAPTSPLTPYSSASFHSLSLLHTRLTQHFAHTSSFSNASHSFLSTTSPPHRCTYRRTRLFLLPPPHNLPHTDTTAPAPLTASAMSSAADMKYAVAAAAVTDVPEVGDITLEAARKQKIHNLKLKTACLSNEEFIQDLHVSDWSETQKQKLGAAHEKAAELLAAVESGTKWALTEAYDVQKLMRVCGLEMSVRELYKPEDKPQFMEIVALKKTLNELKQHPNKTRTVSLTGTIDSGAVKLEKAEEELRQSQLDASDLAKVPVPVVKSLEDCMNVTVVQNALQGNEEQIAAQLAAIEKACEIRNVAIADGEMAIAEEQYYIKAQLLEDLVELVADKFRIIGQTEDENRGFEQIAGTQKRAFQETAALKDAKRRLKGRCEDDLHSLHDAIQKADLEDAEALKRYATQKEKSEQLMAENVERQSEAWRKIQELERALQRLGTERFEEVKRRIEENDREERRRVEYQQFLDVCGQHKKLLELSVYNCDLALRCTGMVEELVAESCSAIKSRHDKMGEELAELRLQVHQEYLEAFRRLYKTLGQLVYKKEKRLEEIDRQIRTTHIQLEFAIETFDPNAKKHSDTKKELYKLRAQVEEELEMLKDKMAQSLEMFGPTEDALHQAGIEFVHPAEEVEDGNLSRRSKIVEYRAHLAKQEEVKIAAEREELKRAKVLQSQQYRGKTVHQITE
nr:unnamed protein product [Leishmania braziliensis]